MCSDVYCICIYDSVLWYGMVWRDPTQICHHIFRYSFLIYFFTIYFLCTFPSYHHSACIHHFLSSIHCVCVRLLFSAPLFVLFVVHSWHVYVFIFSFMSKNCISGLSVECTVVYVCVPVVICASLAQCGGLCSIQTTLYHRTRVFCIFHVCEVS